MANLLLCNKKKGGVIKTVDERLDFLEYRQELLFENTTLSRLLFEYRITREQNYDIMDIFDAYRTTLIKAPSGALLIVGSIVSKF